MATYTTWTLKNAQQNKLDIMLEIDAIASNIVRTSATKFTASIKAEWKTFYSGNKTIWGMKVTTGDKTVVLNSFGNSSSGSSRTFTATYNLADTDGYGQLSKDISVKFEFFDSEHGWSHAYTLSYDSEKHPELRVTVPALKSYTFTYNKNTTDTVTNMPNPSSVAKYHGVDLPISDSIPKRSGYTFSGWAISSTGTYYYGPGTLCGYDGNRTVYAIWTPNKYAVTYNKNATDTVTNMPSNTTKTHGVDLKLSSNIPVRQGYVFGGWVDPDGVSYAADSTYSTNAALNLSAVWSLGYKNPTISNLSVKRCNSDGTDNDEGKCASITFDWTTFYDVTGFSITAWSETDLAMVPRATFSLDEDITNRRSGKITYIYDGDWFSPEHSYVMYVSVSDYNDASKTGSTFEKDTILPSSEFPIDFKGRDSDGHCGVAIGKVAQSTNLLDVNYNSRFRKNVFVGDKAADKDGESGLYLNGDGYIHLQRATGANPHIAFYGSQAAGVNESGRIQYNKTNGALEFANAGGYIFDKNVFHNQNIYIGSKASYNDANPGWYFGSDGSAHAAGARAIYFHYSGSKDSTSYIQEDSSGTITLGNNMKTGAVSANNVRGNGNYQLTFGVANNTAMLQLYQNGGSTSNDYWFRPGPKDPTDPQSEYYDNKFLLGTSGVRWKQIYTHSLTNAASDRNIKCDITAFDERYEKLFASLKPVVYKFIDGDSGRFHSGFISQDVEESLEEVGLTALDFAAFCKDKKTQEVEDPETGEITFIDVCDADGNPEYSYSLRYEEFIALNTHMIQKLQNENSELKAKVELLEERLNKLEELISK